MKAWGSQPATAHPTGLLQLDPRGRRAHNTITYYTKMADSLYYSEYSGLDRDALLKKAIELRTEVGGALQVDLG